MPGGPNAVADHVFQRDTVAVMSQEPYTDFERAVITVLTSTEPGDVLSYGDVAAEAGYPGAARAVGNILARVDGLPWWRVVTAAGRLKPHNPEEQARLLASEGVVCRDGRVVA